MKRFNIILILFSLSITVCIYSVFGGSIFKWQSIHVSPASNNYAKIGAQNNNVNVIYYSDKQLTLSAVNTSVEESYDTTATDNPHLPVAYKTKTHQTNPELELEEDDSNKAKTPYLEAGQSRTFLYPSTGINNANPEENEILDNHENSNTGYFLQPGQSRIFLDTPKDSNSIYEEEG